MTEVERIGTVAAHGVSITEPGFIDVTGPAGLRTRYNVAPLTRPIRPIRGVLLDLDGTSLDSEEFWVSMLSASLVAAGGPPTGLSQADREHLRGGTTRDHLAYVHRSYNLDCGRESFASIYHEVVDAHFFEAPDYELTQSFSLSPGFRELRNYLNEVDIPLALVTNGSEQKARRELEIMAHHLDLDTADVCTTLWCGTNEPETNVVHPVGLLAGKPHPWPYLEAAVVGLGMTAEDLPSVLAVDDTLVGVASARIAGVVPYSFRNSSVAAFANPLAIRVLTRLDELIDEL